MPDLHSVGSTINRYATNSLIGIKCPACGNEPLRGFYTSYQVPVSNVLLMPKLEEARNCPTGNIHLAYCWKCGMITNIAFDPLSVEYSARYEETQGFSPVFNSFNKEIAQYLIDRYHLQGKNILEIGCGKGEFLALICEMGANHGVGFDPAFVREREPKISRGSLEFIAENYSTNYSNYQADLYICKMTLEHIVNVNEFVRMIRRAIGNQRSPIVFFQVPDIQRIFRELAFWDIYYEHCSYFCATSLKRLFRTCGFRVLDVWTGFDDQYLMIEAAPRNTGLLEPPYDATEDLAELFPLISYFSQAVAIKIQGWSQRLMQYAESGTKVVLWGGSSKSVAFLNTLHVKHEIACVVDINPYKTGTFLPGSGHGIIAPQDLTQVKPDIVIVMNPVYQSEIRAQLASMGLFPDLVMINE
jgi:ubiquinone/menaquinone biosynthesis C-methylase UbiE